MTRSAFSQADSRTSYFVIKTYRWYLLKTSQEGSFENVKIKKKESKKENITIIKGYFGEKPDFPSVYPQGRQFII